MTPTDTLDGSAAEPSAPPEHVLRRNPNNRVVAGVCSGLGDYFGLDPVLFRVLIATAAFFGGAGIVAYLLAWIAIPEAGTQRAPLDGWMRSLRRRRFSRRVLAIIAGLILWITAFSWWAPGPVFPVLAVVLLLVVFYGRRDLQGTSAATPDPGTAEADVTADHPTVSLAKDGSDPSDDSALAGDGTDAAATQQLPTADQSPEWAQQARGWWREARAARRERRRRSLPVRIATVISLALTLTVLAIVDAVTGLPMQVYFWTSFGIVLLGLLVGLALRRTPWSLTPLLIPALLGSLAFAGSGASLHDGIGEKQWRPTAAPATQYRLALGQGVLDLTALGPQSGPQLIKITMGAGQTKIITPKTLNVTVLANIHFGRLMVDGVGDDDAVPGIGKTVPPPAGASGQPIVVDVQLADGEVSVEHH